MFTARDILRFLQKIDAEEGGKGYGKGSAFKYTVADLMTKKEKMVNLLWHITSSANYHSQAFCSPSDSVRRVRETMYQLKVRNMPIIDEGKVLGAT